MRDLSLNDKALRNFSQVTGRETPSEDILKTKVYPKLVQKVKAYQNEFQDVGELLFLTTSHIKKNDGSEDFHVVGVGYDLSARKYVFVWQQTFNRPTRNCLSDRKNVRECMHTCITILHQRYTVFVKYIMTDGDYGIKDDVHPETRYQYYIIIPLDYLIDQLLGIRITFNTASLETWGLANEATNKIRDLLKDLKEGFQAPGYPLHEAVKDCLNFLVRIENDQEFVKLRDTFGNLIRNFLTEIYFVTYYLNYKHKHDDWRENLQYDMSDIAVTFFQREIKPIEQCQRTADYVNNSGKVKGFYDEDLTPEEFWQSNRGRYYKISLLAANLLSLPAVFPRVGNGNLSVNLKNVKIEDDFFQDLCCILKLQHDF